MPIHGSAVSPWDNDEILRAELFSSERLEQHDDHLVEEQIREIRQDLPPGFYRQLPKLADGPKTCVAPPRASSAAVRRARMRTMWPTGCWV
jgi:hypothetical protein